MSIEKLKAELQASLSFDAKAALIEAENYDLREPLNPSEVYCYVEAMKSEHTKHARTAQMLIDAIEALESILNDIEYCDWTCERCSKDPEMKNTDIAYTVCETLSKLAKGER